MCVCVCDMHCVCQSCQPHDMQPRETYQKNEWDGGVQTLMEIKYCDSSNVTNNKQKQSQNVMATIFSSGCYAHYIYIL